MGKFYNLYKLIEEDIIEAKIDNNILECSLKDETIHYEINSLLLLFAKKNNIKTIKLKFFNNLKITFSIKKIIYKSDLKIEILPQNENIKNISLYFFALSAKNFDISNCIKPLKNTNIDNLYISGTDNEEIMTVVDLTDFIIKKKLYLTSIDILEGKLKNKTLDNLILVNVKKIKNNPFKNIKINNLRIDNYLVRNNINYSHKFIEHLLKNSKNIELKEFYFNNDLKIENINNILITNSSIKTVFVKNINKLDTFGVNNIENLFVENANRVNIDEIYFGIIKINNTDTVKFKQEYLLKKIPKQIYFNNVNYINLTLSIENFYNIFSIINAQNVKKTELYIKFKNVKEDIKNFLETVYNNFDNISNLNIGNIEKIYEEILKIKKTAYIDILISTITKTKNKKEFIEILLDNYLTILKHTNYIEKNLIIVPNFILNEKKFKNAINSFSSLIKII